MASRGSVFARNYFTRNTSENMFPEDFVFEEQENLSSEEEGSKCMYTFPLK